MKTVFHLTREEVREACIQYALGDDLHRYGTKQLNSIEVEPKFDHDLDWCSPEYVKGVEVTVPPSK